MAGTKAAPDGAGDSWTWAALDADSKLIISYFVGGRDSECSKWFMQDVADRLANRVQLSSDGHRAYLKAVEAAFGADIDYAHLIKSTVTRWTPSREVTARRTHRHQDGPR